MQLGSIAISFDDKNPNMLIGSLGVLTFYSALPLAIRELATPVDRLSLTSSAELVMWVGIAIVALACVKIVRSR